MDWTPGEEHKLQLMLRYKTAAERSFYRSVAAIERFRKVRLQEPAKTEKDSEPEEPPHLSRLDRVLAALQQPVERVPTEHQSIEIQPGDGGPITTIDPSNEELLEQCKNADPPIQRIIRKVHFHGEYLDGLPPEYEWLDDEMPGISNVRDQFLTFDEWLAAVEREKRAGTGHLIPARK
jgi:hypothetical protein